MAFILGVTVTLVLGRSVHPSSRLHNNTSSRLDYNLRSIYSLNAWVEAQTTRSITQTMHAVVKALRMMLVFGVKITGVVSGTIHSETED